MFRYYQNLSERDIILTFKGAMSQDALVELGDLLRVPDADVERVSPSTIKRLFAILVEMAQNILYYSSERQYLPHLNREVGVGLLVLKQNSEAFTIACGNCIESERVADIETKCKFINSLDSEALRQLYNEERRRLRQRDDAGAGLGLIDIARRSGHPLEYSFHEMDASNAFFTLTAWVEKAHRSAQR